MKNKRILLLAEFTEYGGTRTYFKQLVNYFYENGHKVTVALTAEQLDKEIKGLLIEKSYKWTIIKGLNKRYGIVSGYATLLGLVLKHRIQKVVISVGDLPNYVSAFWLPTSVLYVIHTYPSVPFGKSISRILNKRLGKTRTILTVSNFSKQNIVHWWGLDNKKEVFVNYIYNYSAIDSTLCIDKNCPPIILTIGHVKWYKNPLWWVEVAKKITDNWVSKEKPIFLWVGDGELLIKCKKACNTYNNIKFLGYSAQPEKYYGQATLYFQPSLLESHGISVVEAMKAGVPCVVSAVGGLTESVIDGFTGVVIRNNDIEFTSYKITRLLNDEKTRILLGENGKKRFNKVFAKKRWEKSMRLILDDKKIRGHKNEGVFPKRLNPDKIPLISVIIPTYNTAKYIKRAIDSLLIQRIQNLEIIVVDDASTDDTGAILKKNYHNNPNVKIVKNTYNKKQGACRNIGLDMAGGKYVFFLDSDDWLNKGGLLHLASIAEETNAEITACGIDQVWGNGKKERYHGSLFSSEGGLDALDKYAEHLIGSIVWNKLYRRDFIEKNHLRFVENNIKEDIIFTAEAVYNCKSYISISDVYCNYFQRKNSCVNIVPTFTHLVSYIQLYIDMISFVEKYNLNESTGDRHLVRRLLAAHSSGIVIPGLIRYADTHTDEEWIRDCWEACGKISNLFGSVLPDFFIASVRALKDDEKSLKATHSELSAIYKSKSWKIVYLLQQNYRKIMHSKLIKAIKGVMSRENNE